MNCSDIVVYLHKAAASGRGLQFADRDHWSRLYGGHAIVRTIGYHIVKSCYGMWLPGDSRGSWSEAWDEQIGFFEPHHLHARDPIRERMAAERQSHPAVKMDLPMMIAVAEAIRDCVAKGGNDFRVAAIGIDRTHMHIALHYSDRDIDRTVKWLSDQTTKHVHRSTSHTRPLWCKGRWRGFVYDELVWRNTVAYVERHNIRRGLPARPYEWLS